jgi:hypothetical protein
MKFVVLDRHVIAIDKIIAVVPLDGGRSRVVLMGRVTPNYDINLTPEQAIELIEKALEGGK